ncbi:hypothetical protein RSAG8_06691, partial [Rhizoctonia solani AG-8 WAC10335]
MDNSEYRAVKLDRARLVLPRGFRESKLGWCRDEWNGFGRWYGPGAGMKSPIGMTSFTTPSTSPSTDITRKVRSFIENATLETCNNCEI